MRTLLYICYLPRSVRIGKTVAEVLVKTKGTVFPNTDRPRPGNNLFIFSYFNSGI